VPLKKTFLNVFKCVGEFHCDISINAYSVPGLDSPPTSLSFTPFSLLKMISSGFIDLFHTSI
jgi:hypothetical protein